MNYTHCAYSKPSYFFLRKLCHNVKTELGKVIVKPHPFLRKQFRVKQLESKINIWYLDDGNLADDYKVVLPDLKNILKSEQTYGLGELCFWDRLRVLNKIQENALK